VRLDLGEFFGPEGIKAETLWGVKEFGGFPVPHVSSQRVFVSSWLIFGPPGRRGGQVSGSLFLFFSFSLGFADLEEQEGLFPQL